MLNVIGNKIIITKGDSASFNLSVYYAGMKELYELKDGDSLRFYLSKKDKNTGKVRTVINKLLNGYKLELKSIDTFYLESGIYQYEIQLIFNNGDVNTVVGPSIMELTDSISTYNVEISPLLKKSIFFDDKNQVQLIGELNIGVEKVPIENIDLDDLADVVLSQGEDGDILTYENNKWINSNIQEIIEDTSIVLDCGEI